METLTLTRCTDLVQYLTATDPILDSANREISRVVDLRTDGDTTLQLQLVTHHSKTLKGYLISAHVVSVVDRGEYTVTKSRPFEDGRRRRLPGIPAARHSEKALRAADAEAMILLDEDPSWLENLDLTPMLDD